MKTFSDFITEAAVSGVASAKHQEHPEDNAVKSKAGFAHAISSLRSIHKGLQSGSSGDTQSLMEPLPLYLDITQHQVSSLLQLSMLHLVRLQN